MRKKLLTVLLIGLLFIAGRVKADSNAFLIESNYTTVVKGDTLYLKAGFDTLWDESLIKDDSEKNELMTFYIAFSAGFTANFDDIKFVNNNYNFDDYRFDYYTDKDEKTYYLFSRVYVNEVKETADEDDGMYNGKINVPIIENIKVKVDNNLEGTYMIDTGFMLEKDDEETDYYDEEDEENEEDEDYEEKFVVESLPVTVISKNSNNKLRFLMFKTESEGLGKGGDNIVDLKDGKYDYEFPYYSLSDSLDFINAACYSRCKITNIGTDRYIDFEDSNQITVTYENGKTYKYTFKNELEKATIYHEWDSRSFAKNVMIIGNKESSELLERIFEAHTSDNYIIKRNYYNYEDLNDIDKKIIKELLDKDFDLDTYNGPYWFVINDDNEIYHSKGNLTEEEIKSVYERFGILTEEDKKETTTNNKILNIGDKYLIIGTICTILLIVIITIIVILKKDNK